MSQLKRYRWWLLLGAALIAVGSWAALAINRAAKEHDQDTQAVRQLADYFGSPIQVIRIEGLAGFRRVNALRLPPVWIDDDEARRVAEKLKALPELHMVDASSATLSPAAREILERALPDVAFGKVGFAGMSPKPETIR